ncbi:MAG TPA: hypothetical protein VH138_08765 [Vicinamibacterales bacterium]|nr:hypothetical protein [Vicinamibacterales bacterium]
MTIEDVNPQSVNRQSPIVNRKWTWALIAVLAVSALVVGLLVPPAPQPVDTAGWNEIAARTIPGAYHVHTTRSDGHGDKHDVAVAAARAGLKFVILTDHGDATRPPDPPEYIDGVLCLDAVEISTDQGHLVALDMPRAPYPLGGAADAVVEDVHRLGGFAIAAHPDSPRPALRWTDTEAPIDGLEWLNADSEWRKDSRSRLIRAGLGYFFRPGPALASLMDRPATLARWDALAARRPIVGLAAVDAHGGVGQRSEDVSRSVAGTIGIPAYQASFRTLSNRVILDAPPTGDAARDARAIYDAIRKGSVFTTIDALASPGLLDLRADGNTVVAHAARPRGSELDLFHAGSTVSASNGDLREAATSPGPYRVEVHLAHAPGDPPIPWLVSNFVYVGAAVPSNSGSSGTGSAAVPGSIAPFPWRIEKDAASSAILRTREFSVELEYQLAPGSRNSQFVALASDVRDESFTAIRLGLQADRPSRVWVQVRSRVGRRWGRTYYVDPAGTELLVRLADLRSMEEGQVGAPDPRSLSSILLVIDLTNAAPGKSGRLTVLSSALVK